MEEQVSPGMWSPQEFMLYINVLELRAVRVTCKQFHPCIRSQSIQVVVRLYTTVYYINKQGGAYTSQLYVEAIALWSRCIPMQ